MSSKSPSPKVLLLHDSELNEARDLLKGLGVPFVDRIGSPTDIDSSTVWDVVIASEKRIRQFSPKDAALGTIRIAIIDNDSRTLRSLLKRIGVNFIAARPVHRAAFRLLVLHAIYRGPERRRQTRVSVGAPVQIRSRLRKRDAVLTDLSLRSARVLSRGRFKEGARLKIFLSPELSPDKAYALPGRVVRSHPANGGDGGCVTAIEFDALSPNLGKRLRGTFESFRSGPARLSRDRMADSATGTDPSIGERRTASRHEYSKHIVALDDEATRVLVSRDISIGGMRVEPNDSLVPGDELRVAIHLGSPAEPMVVKARVMRDDGPKGLVLTFHGLNGTGGRHLSQLIDQLPQRNDNSAIPPPDFVMSEIVERQSA